MLSSGFTRRIVGREAADQAVEMREGNQSVTLVRSCKEPRNPSTAYLPATHCWSLTARCALVAAN